LGVYWFIGLLVYWFIGLLGWWMIKPRKKKGREGGFAFYTLGIE